MKTFLRNTIFFIGWMLSPLTFWNDAFVNIPLSYLLANIFIRFFPFDFLTTVLVCYWLSNIIGLVMMYISGKDIIKDKRHLGRELFNLLITTLCYSLLVIALNKVGILRPL
jgi:hypothetical protein